MGRACNGHVENEKWAGHVTGTLKMKNGQGM